MSQHQLLKHEEIKKNKKPFPVLSGKGFSKKK